MTVVWQGPFRERSAIAPVSNRFSAIYSRDVTACVNAVHVDIAQELRPLRKPGQEATNTLTSPSGLSMHMLTELRVRIPERRSLVFNSSGLISRRLRLRRITRPSRISNTGSAKPGAVNRVSMDRRFIFVFSVGQLAMRLFFIRTSIAGTDLQDTYHGT